MDSPLGSALANIFVGYHKKKLFWERTKPAVYFKDVDDTFAMFQNKKELKKYLIKIIGMHHSLKFTSMKEKNKCLPFRYIYY